MSDTRWGHDQEPVESSSEISNKLFWLAIFASSGAIPFALHQRMFATPGFQWPVCAWASFFGILGALAFAWKEKLPRLLGLLPGAVAGAGSYSVNAGYLSMRNGIRIFELIASSLIGAIPGIVLFVLFVRIYYAVTNR